MKIELKPAVKLTVSVGEDERHEHNPLYQAVLRILHSEGLAGATLTKGVMSFGVQGRVHTTKNEVLMANLPVIIEAVDERAKVERAAALVAALLGGHGLVEIQPTMVACQERGVKERREI